MVHGVHNDDKPWEEGWEAWLHEQRMWDPSKTRHELYTRYRKFSRITFEVIPRSDWWQFYRDLLPMENGFAYGEAIGHVDYPFEFEVTDARPIS